MGKKKGRQRGQFASKSIRASHQTEAFHRAEEETKEWRCTTKKNKKKTTSRYSSNGTGSICDGAGANSSILSHATTRASLGPRLQSQVHPHRESQRVAVSVDLGHLRGLLRERAFDDRSRRHERQLRQHLLLQSSRRHGGQDTIGGRNAAKNNNGNPKNELGWTLSYNHREFLAGITNCTATSHNTNMSNIPSLQQICLKSLASPSILPAYIDAFGIETVHQILSTLPGHVLTELSTYCTQEVTDEVVFVVGNHSHLKGLVLNASSSASGVSKEYRKYQQNNNENDMEDEKSTLTGQLCTNDMTDFAFRSLIPKLVCSTNSNNNIFFDETTSNGNISTIDSDDTMEDLDEESWETLDNRHDNELFTGCWKLERFELHNYQNDRHHFYSTQHLVHFLGHCPKLTHLSLSNSLNKISGPDFLFNEDDDGVGGTILDILRNLQILDLSHCSWLNYELLHTFLSRITRKTFMDEPSSIITNTCEGGISPLSTSLQMISIVGCNPNIYEKIDSLNRLTRGKPMLSITPQTKQ